jgi:hypothetical protein
MSAVRFFTLSMSPLKKWLMRKWLQSNIKGWERDLEVIARQRANDFAAESVIQREIAFARSDLNDLN